MSHQNDMRATWRRTGRVLALATAAACACLIARCANQVNPYRDTSLANLEIVAVEDSPVDTISIFSTTRYAVQLYVQAHMRSLSLQAPGNRLWGESGMAVDLGALNGSQAPFAVSYADPGPKTVTATAILSDGTVRRASLSLIVRNPLKQQAIMARENDTVTLSTDPVADTVQYVWDFGSGITVSSAAPRATFALVGLPLILKANLYVKAGAETSPSVPFDVTLLDVTPPSVVCTNSGIRNDTLRTSRGLVRLFFTVHDASPIKEVTVDGERLTAVDTMGERYTVSGYTEIGGLAALATGVRPVVVAAADVRGNRMVDTLWLRYDSTGSVSDVPVIVVHDPANEVDTVQNRTVIISGVVRNVTYDSLFLFVQVNDSLYPNPVALSRQVLSWQHRIYLDRQDNQVTLRISRFRGSLGEIATQLLTLTYNPLAVDNTPPYISAVRCNGQVVTSSFYTESTQVAVSVAAYDVSGLREVRIGGVAAVLRDSVYAATVPLVHRLAGNDIAIEAVDSSEAANKAATSITVYRNAPPRFLRLPTRTYIYAGQQMTDSVRAADADGDPLTLSLTITHGPAAARADTQFNLDSSGRFSWTPTIADTAGLVEVAAVAWDGIQEARASFSFAVITGAAVADTTWFITTEADFPDTLVAGRDTLRQRLHVRRTSASTRLVFVGSVDPAGLSVVPNPLDSLVYWVPQPADTGLRHLLVSFTSSSGFDDTLRPAITILPPVRASFERGLDTVAETAGACSVAVELSRPSTDTVRVAVSVDTAQTTAGAADYTLATASPLVFAPGSTRMTVRLTIVNDTLVEPAEAFTAQLSTVTPGVLAAEPKTYRLLIVSEDTATVRIDTPSVYFATPDSAGRESAYTVPVAVKLSFPAQQALQVSLSASGAAQQGLDYTLSANRLTFAVGDSVKYVTVGIMDDTVYEPDEKLTLTLTSPQAVKLGTPSSYSFIITANDTPAGSKTVVVVKGAGTISWQDQMLVDSIATMGFTPVQVTEAAFNAASLTGAAAVVISQSVQGSVGAIAANSAAPVFCANDRDYVALGFATAADTGSLSMNAVKIAAGNGIVTTLSGAVQVFKKAERANWFTRRPTGMVVATANTDTAKVVVAAFARGTALANGSSATSKRIAFVMLDASVAVNAGTYKAEWFIMLGQCLRWLLSGG